MISPFMVLLFGSEDCARVLCVDERIALCERRGHRLTTHQGSETLYPRRGCLDCDVWFDKPRLRKP